MASVADVIHEHRDEIMRHWLAEARATASGRGLSATALENVMPMFLSALADQIETGQLDANDRRRMHVQTQLSTRLRQGFDLAEIVDEFLLMGRCISRTWQDVPPPEQPSAPDVERLHAQIDAAVAEVTDAFHRHMLEDEQAEKRSFRLLQDIASQALNDASRPMSERHRDVLDVAMGAMDAQCAAFLRYDASQARFTLVASTGVQPFEPYATSLDPRSFADEIAAHEEPTSLRDTTTTRLDVPASLRRSGVHSLLGVRLPAPTGLLGVMYVGIVETREFTARELRRIASLGERIALHLENARLVAELQDKIASLDIETTLRERFVSMLAHDLRGPLSAARLQAQLLAMEPESLDKRRELGVKIERNIMRVDQMIRDLLDASRIRAGEPLPLRIDSCDLAALVGQVAEEARAMYGDRFEVETDEPIRGFWSAEDLHRALWNLISNAVKYGAAKQPITIATGRHDDVVRVSVHNAGTPIPAAEQAQIFDAYARARANASGRPGWGLGLTIVRGVSEAHGGRVSVASDARSGTTFTIELPIDARVARPGSERGSTATIH